MEIDRDEAERLYVDMVISNGNPRYFVHQIISGWDHSTLEQKLEEMSRNIDGDDFQEFFIVEEE